MKQLIYLDNNATTATDPFVVEAMLPYFSQNFGNPSSNSHLLSWKAEEAIYVSRTQVAKLLNAESYEIFFTSGATEGNNLIMKGLSLSNKDHIIVPNIEHKCVLETASYLQQKHFVEVHFLEVGTNGVIDVAQIEMAIKENTKLISLMFINNEIHTINNIEKIGQLCMKYKILFHVDAAQAVGKIEIDLKKLNVDFLTISAHKFYGPKGIGVLYMKGGSKSVKLTPLMHGGGQENGLRSGTLAVPLIVGLGKAAELAHQSLVSRIEIKRISTLTRSFFNTLQKELHVKLNGCPLEERQLGGLNLTFDDIDTGELQFHIPHICYSRGSACSSGSLDYSYVLKAIGLNAKDAIGTLRLCIGRFNTEEDIYFAVNDLTAAVQKLSKNKFHFFKNQVKS